MTVDTSRSLGPEEQIHQVRASLDRLIALPACPERDQQLRDAEAYLEQLLELHARGELHPLTDHTDLPL